TNSKVLPSLVCYVLYFFSVYYSLRFSSSPVGWLRFNNKCFMFKGKKNDIKGNWSYARSWCREQGGDLAVIDDQYENEQRFPPQRRDLELPTWIGLSDLLVENQYAWSDGVSPVLYTNWNDKEPNNANGDEGCVSMHASRMFHGTWNDTKCDLEKPYICKKTSGTSSIRTEL
uniref:C-type lectin domain-containing protein n=1 Tax=Neolamprologus brichardi TaxID=32507 RepID=A0A3Q4H2E4_NEOBR